MRQYLDLLDRILSEGAEKTDRTEQGRSVFSVIRCVLIYRQVFLC